jgi:glyoxylase-like metal-dependent hydrolase (beta-lactamase superfamily II)
MRVEQLRPHLWRWTAPHPDWRSEHAEGGQGWEREVGCSAIVRDDEFVLIDPLAPTDEADSEEFWHAVDRDVEHHGPPHIVLTVAWHRRSADEVWSRYDATRVWAYLGETEGGTATDRYDPDTELPGGLRAFDAAWATEAVLWSEEHRALFTGDVILGAPGGLRLLPDAWVPEGKTRKGIAEALAPLLELPVELVLPAHGEPVLANGAAALERALNV